MITRARLHAQSTECSTAGMLDAMHQHALDMYGEIQAICKDEVAFVRLPASVRDAVSRMEEHIGHLDILACVVKEDVAGDLAQIEQLERVWLDFQEYIRAGQAVISRMSFVPVDLVTNDQAVPDAIVEE